MLHLEPIFEFSRLNCVAICTFLVSANLLVTLQTLILLARKRPSTQIRWSAIFAIIFASTLFLHVSTWFMIGVVTPVTFILLGLGTTCLVVNILANIYRQRVPVLVQSLRDRLAI